MSKLSPTQQDCLQAAQDSDGVLYRYSGGFWSAPNVETKTSMGQKIPSWHFGTNTVRALLKKGVFEVLEEKRNSSGSFPSAVYLKAQ